MKAMIIRESGEASVFEVADIPVPQIGSAQVLVRVAATSVNPVDWKIRKFAPPLGPDLPAVLHGDVAGVVDAVGADVSDFAVGDEIYGCAGGSRVRAGRWPNSWPVTPTFLRGSPTICPWWKPRHYPWSV